MSVCLSVCLSFYSISIQLYVILIYLCIHCFVPCTTEATRFLSATDPGPILYWTQLPRRHPDLRDRNREGPFGCRNNPQAASVEPPSTPFSSRCQRQCVYRSHWARTGVNFVNEDNDEKNSSTSLFSDV